ncbi:MAG: TonB-dependent receptor, partial [Acidobacteria bacterium]|nr:TonB-dependent receptor [Acidobacteriota bacterium]
MNRLLKIGAFAFLLIALCSESTLAQNRGAITGRVKDSTDAAIPGVAIKVINVNTGIERDTITNELGLYTVELLVVGQYRVEAELAGFKKEVRSGITLQVDQIARIDIVLAVGEVTEVVEVRGQAPLVQTEDSSLGAVIDDRKVTELPLNGRDFSNLAYIIPGAFRPIQGSALGYRGGFTVGGADESTNQFILDGINNNGTGTMEIAGRINIDALQEFKIQTSTYSAQYGRYAGAQVNAVSKSGTNELHGTGFFFHRNDNLDARNFFDPWPLENLPEFRRHQYGATLGGPIVKNKTFFFGSYQGQRQVRFLTRTGSVPLPQFFNGDLSARTATIIDPLTGNPFPNKQIPQSRIWAGARTVAQFWPTAQQVTGPTGTATSLLPEPNNFHQFSAKLDHQLNSMHSIAGSHNYFNNKLIEYEIAGNPRIPGFATDSVIVAQHTSISFISAISPTTINEFRTGQSRVRRGRFQEIRGRDFNAQLGILGTTADGNDLAKGVPRFNVTGFESIGDATNMPQPRVDQTFTWMDTVSFQRGAHSLKAGIDVYRQQMNLVFVTNGRGTFAFDGTQTGDAFADFLLGYPASTSRNVSLVRLDNHPRKTSINAFFQDDWKMTPNLTLNLGVRYEVNTSLVEKYNKLSTFDRTTLQMRVATGDTPLYESDKNNFAPRLGFAWRPFGDTSFVARGGYGLFYNIDDLCFCNFRASNPPFFRTEQFLA